MGRFLLLQMNIPNHHPKLLYPVRSNVKPVEENCRVHNFLDSEEIIHSAEINDTSYELPSFADLGFFSSSQKLGSPKEVATHENNQFFLKSFERKKFRFQKKKFQPR